MPRVMEGSHHGFFDRKIMAKLGELGFLGSILPEQYEGAGVSHVCYELVDREVERVDFGYRSAMSVQSSLVMHLIFIFGTDSIKQK